MKPGSKTVLTISGLVGTFLLGAASGAGKMLTTDLWPSLRPIISNTSGLILGFFTWLAEPVAFPMWSFIAAFFATIAVIGFLLFRVLSLGEDLSEANAKLNPKLPPLDERAQQVLAVIAKYGGNSEGLYLSQIPKITGLSELVYEGAMDALDHWNLVHILHSAWGDQVTLSARGRAYILDRDSPLAWVVDNA